MIPYAVLKMRNHAMFLIRLYEVASEETMEDFLFYLISFLNVHGHSTLFPNFVMN